MTTTTIIEALRRASLLDGWHQSEIDALAAEIERSGWTFAAVRAALRRSEEPAPAPAPRPKAEAKPYAFRIAPKGRQSTAPRTDDPPRLARARLDDAVEARRLAAELGDAWD